MKLYLQSISPEDDNNILDLTTFTVSDDVFKYPFNPKLIHQVVSSYLTNSRQGTKAQKSKGEVSSSNKKPWRQKGTGRARSGSIASPLWRSGGVTFAAKPKIYNQKINKKMYRGAIKSILSKLICDNRLFLIKDFVVMQPKTKLLLDKVNKITTHSNVLIITEMFDKNLMLASRNLYRIKICNAMKVDPVSLINFDITVFTCDSINKIENQLK